MKTLVLGASTNQERYSNKAIKMLRAYGHEVVAIGRDTGSVADVEIEKVMDKQEGIDTVTLYVNPSHQKEYYNTIIALKPRRIIFNPGTENSELELLAANAGIKSEEACTLVLLSSNQY